MAVSFIMWYSWMSVYVITVTSAHTDYKLASLPKFFQKIVKKQLHRPEIQGLRIPKQYSFSYTDHIII